ncbi:hypothetical protein LMG31506_03964 [Cupriavidus yeoncheonensis]|uniref:Sodium symporter small subunit domain-containing protein n=1 Tax=Cupriavidus yeoncheonensis TaxID=1462994 RepID=A0A916IX63_9BURK|nr:DUF4212 domain-containing protein [Cupriavidus yeoncheonensis]CAG2149169.1 hypothetical protein LMG31506_03964 [Cupriavidus yeoncheonensis]
MSAHPPVDPALKRAWRRNQRWICALLAVWFVVTFVVSWFARDLRFDFFGWPFSFWMGAQGALVVYVLMTALYAWRMNRADDETDGEADEGATDVPPPSQGMPPDAGKDAA